MAQGQDGNTLSCAQCGAAMALTDSTDDNGEFREEYECANGHTGWFTGDEDDYPESWEFDGAVFVEGHV